MKENILGHLRLIGALTFIISLPLVAFEYGVIGHIETLNKVTGLFEVPAYILERKEAKGYACLMLGWIALAPAWFANPLFIASICLNKGSRVARTLSSIGLVLALTAIANPVGTSMEIRLLREGYYLWLLSISILWCYHHQHMRYKHQPP